MFGELIDVATEKMDVMVLTATVDILFDIFVEKGLYSTCNEGKLSFGSSDKSDGASSELNRRISCREKSRSQPSSTLSGDITVSSVSSSELNERIRIRGKLTIIREVPVVFVGEQTTEFIDDRDIRIISDQTSDLEENLDYGLTKSFERTLRADRRFS